MQRFLRRLALIVLSSAVTVAAMEAAFRPLMVKRFEKASAAFQHDLFFCRPGTRYLYTMPPDTVRENRVSDQPDAWKWTFTTDESGRRVVRDSDAAKPDAAKPDGRASGPRIVALGDSYTFGWGVEDEHTYPAQLETLLRADPAFPVLEVVNAGTPGFNTLQQAAYLAKHWDELRPDAVVLGFVMNDAEPPRVAPRDPRERFSEASSWLWEELLLRTGWTDGPFTSRAQRRRPFLLQFADGAPEAALCRRSLRDIAEQCASHSVPLLLFILPSTAQVPKTPEQDYPYDLIHRTVRRWGDELGVPTFDLLPLIDDKSREVMIVPGDGHPSEYALGLFAEAMVPAVTGALRAQK